MTDHVVAADRDLGLQGHYAGIVTRFAAFVIDIATAATLFVLGALVVAVHRLCVDRQGGKAQQRADRLDDRADRMVDPLLRVCPERGAAGPSAWQRSACGWSGSTGASSTVGHAVLRVLIFPLSFLLFGLGFPPDPGPQGPPRPARPPRWRVRRLRLGRSRRSPPVPRPERAPVRAAATATLARRASRSIHASRQRTRTVDERD